MRSKEDIKAYLKTTIEDVTLGQKAAAGILDSQSLLSDLGLDSLDYASTLLEAEHWLGIRVREDGVDWGALRTVGDLGDFLFRQQATA